VFIDILNSNNYISFNIKTAQIFGLNTAVYISEIFNIVQTVKRKQKFVDKDYFKLDRKYVFIRTTLSIEEQLRIDEKLVKVGILYKHTENPDTMKIDVKMFASIITSDDVELIEDLSKKLEGLNKKDPKESKKQAIITALKNSIQCSDYELLTALRDWVDAIFANPKGNYLSNASIKLFQETLNNYTKGDLDLALRLIKIATIQGYRDCTWAISVYEKDNQIKKNIQDKQPRVTTQKRATAETLGEKEF
jgi:hypothetical protein